MRQILYGASCNRLHSMEERCARWLLMTHDRAGQDTFPLTQEFLSHMLGVRRASVNVDTGMLKKAGFIRYVRGKITVIDRPGPGIVLVRLLPGHREGLCLPTAELSPVLHG